MTSTVATGFGSLGREGAGSASRLPRAGVPSHLGAEVELAEPDGSFEMRWEGGTVLVDKAIATSGRRPNIEGLDLETPGVSLDEKSMPEVDPEPMRIGDTAVPLAEDANGARPLLHEGTDEGHTAGLNAMSTDLISVMFPMALSDATRLRENATRRAMGADGIESGKTASDRNLRTASERINRS